MKMKKLTAILTATAMTAVMLAGCGNTTAKTETTTDKTETETAATEETATAETAKDLTGVEISFLNSKGEVQSALEEMAVAFEEETGIKVDILSCGVGEVPYTKITSAYNSGTAPTMAMLDGTDIQALAKDYALDLSSEEWVNECDTMKLDGTVYSFPFCVEGRGLIYNKAAI